jgi:multiple sugar transport system substrate-binding protein
MGLFLLSFIACAGCGQAARSASSAAADVPIAITLWTQDTWFGVTGHELDDVPLDDSRRAQYTRIDWYKKTAEEFKRAHPELNVEFEMEALDWSQTSFQKLDIAVAAGHPPDIMVSTSATTLKYARYGMLEPFDDEISEADKKDFAEFWNLSEVYGKHYFLPFIGGNRYIACNRLIFKERNAEHLLPKQSDRTWTFEEFVRAAQATTFVREQDIGERKAGQVWGYAMPFQRANPTIDHGPFLWGCNGWYFDPTGSRMIVNSPEAARGLQFMVDLEHTYKVMPPGSAGMRASDVADLWNAGKLAMQLGAHSTKISFERSLKQGLIQPGVIEIYPVMFPHQPGNKPAVFVVADSPCVFKQPDPRKRRIAIEFVKFMTNAQHEREVSHALSTLPTRRSALDVWGKDAYQQYVLRVTKYGTKDAIQPYSVALRDMINFSFQAAMTRQLTPQQALNELAARANRFIQREEKRRKRAMGRT